MLVKNFLKYTFVTGINGIRRVAGIQASKSMVPFCGYRRASSSIYDHRRYGRLVRVNSTVADEVVGRHVRDRLYVWIVKRYRLMLWETNIHRHKMAHGCRLCDLDQHRLRTLPNK